MELFRDRVAAIGGEERSLLGRIVAESAASFSIPLNDPGVTQLRRREEPPFGSEQLVCAALKYQLCF